MIILTDYSIIYDEHDLYSINIYYSRDPVVCIDARIQDARSQKCGYHLDSHDDSSPLSGTTNEYDARESERCKRFRCCRVELCRGYVKGSIPDIDYYPYGHLEL